MCFPGNISLNACFQINTLWEIINILPLPISTHYLKKHVLIEDSKMSCRRNKSKHKENKTETKNIYFCFTSLPFLLFKFLIFSSGDICSHPLEL